MKTLKSFCAKQFLWVGDSMLPWLVWLLWESLATQINITLFTEVKG